MADTVQITIIGKDQASASLRAVREEVVDLGDASDDTRGLLGKLGSTLASLGTMAVKVAAVAATGAIIAFGAALKGGIEGAREQAQVMAQTEQTITSMGNAAGVSAQHVADFASSLSAASGKSLFPDTEIQKATNMLLTFGNIKGATLDLATTLTVDMAQALKKTPEDMSIMVGKILNSADAMSTAQRQGVSFSDEQLKLGKRLFETGHIAEYQQLVLNELNKEFGGQAAAAAKADGGWAQFHDRLGEAAETMGTAVLPLLNGLASVLNDTVMPIVETAAARFGDLIAAFQTGAEGGDVLGGLTNALYSLGDVSPIFDDIGDAVNDLAQSFEEGGIGGLLNNIIYDLTGVQGAASPLVDVFSGLAATFTDAQDPVTGLLDVLSEVSPGFALLRGVAEETLPQIQALVESVFGDTAAYLQENGGQMLAEAQATWQSIHDTVLSLVEPLAGVINAILEQIQIFWEANGQDILAFVGETWTQINSIIQLAMQLIQATVVPALQFIAQFIRDHSAEIQAVLSTSWEAIKLIVNTAVTLVRGILTAALQAIRGDWSGAWDTIKQMSATVVQNLLNLFKLGFEQIKIIVLAVWNGIKFDLEHLLDSIVGYVIQTMQGIANAVTNFGKAAESAASAVGSAIISGIVGGIKDGAGAIVEAAKDAAMSALSAAKSALGISSPSTEFAEVGENINLGLIAGMESMLPAVLAQMGTLGKEMLDKAESIANSVHEALADAFDASASIDRQKARNLDSLSEFSAEMQRTVQAQLREAETAAAQIADPGEAAQFFKERSQQIMELAGLRDQMARNQAQIDQNETQVLDARGIAEQARLKEANRILSEKVVLIEHAQQAETQAANIRREQHTDALDQIAGQVHDLADTGKRGVPEALAELMRLLSGGVPTPGAPGTLAPALAAPGGQGAAPTGQAAVGGGIQVVFQSGAIVGVPGQSMDQLVDVLLEKIRQRTGGRL